MLELLKTTGKETYKSYAEKYGSRAGELALIQLVSTLEISKAALLMEYKYLIFFFFLFFFGEKQKNIRKQS